MLSHANTSAVIHCSAKAVLSIQMALPQHLQDVAICHSLMLRHTGHPQRYSPQYQQNARLLSSDSQGETLRARRDFAAVLHPSAAHALQSPLPAGSTSTSHVLQPPA